MKKALKVAGIVVAAAAAAGFAGCQVLAARPAAPTDYQRTLETGGSIEAAYLADGPYEVAEHEQTVLQQFEKFEVFYPLELETSYRRWPVVVLCNGSGTPLSKYPAVARHYASWGFVVIGTEETYSWNAFGAEMCLRYLELMDANQSVGMGDEAQESFLYGKVDFEEVGVVGHSQGGVGVLNAVTATEHAATYKAAVALSPTNEELAEGLMWDYDATKVTVPTLLVSGAGGGDDLVVTGEQLEAIYEDVAGPKFMMRRSDTPHDAMLYSADGYVTAWLCWQLQGDKDAAKAFVGDAPEALSNPLYQDQRVDLEE